jgi:hypothetical protein
LRDARDLVDVGLGQVQVLSDVIPINSPGGLGNVFSIGDVLIAAGGAALVYSATRRPYTG